MSKDQEGSGRSRGWMRLTLAHRMEAVSEAELQKWSKAPPITEEEIRPFKPDPNRDNYPGDDADELMDELVAKLQQKPES